jgi:hypothetical protein
MTFAILAQTWMLTADLIIIKLLSPFVIIKLSLGFFFQNIDFNHQTSRVFFSFLFFSK